MRVRAAGRPWVMWVEVWEEGGGVLHASACAPRTPPFSAPLGEVMPFGRARDVCVCARVRACRASRADRLLGHAAVLQQHAEAVRHGRLHHRQL